MQKSLCTIFRCNFEQIFTTNKQIFHSFGIAFYEGVLNKIKYKSKREAFSTASFRNKKVFLLFLDVILNKFSVLQTNKFFIVLVIAFYAGVLYKIKHKSK